MKHNVYMMKDGDNDVFVSEIGSDNYYDEEFVFTELWVAIQEYCTNNHIQMKRAMSNGDVTRKVNKEIHMCSEYDVGDNNIFVAIPTIQAG